MYSHHFMHQLTKTVTCGTNTIKSHLIKMAYTHFILNILKLYPFLSLVSPLQKDSELGLGIILISEPKRSQFSSQQSYVAKKL